MQMQHHRGRRSRIKACRWLLILMVCWVAPCTAATVQQKEVHLYFIDGQKPFLTAEARIMVVSDDPVIFGRQIVAGLIDGPHQGALAALPERTQLRSFFILDDGTAVADFAESIRDRHTGSCRLEQLTLFSVVNSLILNVAEIDRVKILIGGEEAESLAGHLPLRFALTADMRLIR